MKEKSGVLKAFYKLSPVILPILLLILWEIASRAGIIRPTILPAPGKILSAAGNLISKGTLQTDIGISLSRVVKGYVFGAALGVTVGILMGIFPIVERILCLLTDIFRPIPIVAWVPVLILWMGIDESSKVTVIAIGTFWPVLLNVTDGIRNVDVKYKEVAFVLRKNMWITLTKVIFPAALPQIFTGLRVGVGTAWVSVIGAELIASSSGLGYLISYSRELSQPANMLVGVFSIGLIGMLINKILVQLEKHSLKWNVNLKSIADDF